MDTSSMTHIEMVAHYESQFKKVLHSWGATSRYTTHAFFNLQGAMMGLSVAEIVEYTEQEMERLHAKTLELV